MKKLIAHLKSAGVLQSPRIEKSLFAVDRRDFVPENVSQYAYADEPLPIGFGQTISQPTTVVFMLELLDAREKDAVLEVGYGSGWQTALLSHRVGEQGAIFSMEIIPELCRLGEGNVKKYPELAKRVRFFCKSAAPGLPDEAKKLGGFDRIIAAAEVQTVPPAWRKQLKKGGILVYPLRGSIIKETKKSDGTYTIETYPGFIFVPFVNT